VHLRVAKARRINAGFLYAAVQTPGLRDAYLSFMESTVQGTPSRPDELRLSVPVAPGGIYENSSVLLARAHSSGTLELLTSAWEKLLGYVGQELAGKKLSHFLRTNSPVATVAAILDEHTPDPLELTVSCRAGRMKNLRLYRRFDPQGDIVYIVAEEMPERLPQA
jgi:PAS domain-containing protein